MMFTHYFTTLRQKLTLHALLFQFGVDVLSWLLIVLFWLLIAQQIATFTPSTLLDNPAQLLLATNGEEILNKFQNNTTLTITFTILGIFFTFLIRYARNYLLYTRLLHKKMRFITYAKLLLTGILWLLLYSFFFFYAIYSSEVFFFFIFFTTPFLFFSPLVFLFFVEEEKIVGAITSAFSFGISNIRTMLLALILPVLFWIIGNIISIAASKINTTLGLVVGILMILLVSALIRISYASAFVVFQKYKFL